MPRAWLARIQPGPGLTGKHLVGIQQRAGGGDQPAGRQCQGDVVVAIPHVELGVPQVLVGLPAVEVVIHRHLGIPVVDVERFAVLAAPGSAIGGNPKLPGKRELGRPARWQRLRQSDPHDGSIHRISYAFLVDRLELLALCGHPAELDPFDRPGDIGVMPGTGGKDVVEQLDVHFLKGIGRAVVIGHRSLAGQPLGDRIELGLQVVVGPLLPVAWPRGSGAGPGAPSHRAVEGLGDRELHAPNG